MYQGWEIKSTGRAELAGGADAVGYSPVKDTLFVASGGKIFYKSDVGEIDDSMFGEPAVDFEGETVQRFTAAGDVMVAVYEHRIVEFRHDGERWRAEPSAKFGGEQKLRGMVRTDYDDESNMFSEYKYLTDKGVVDSTITEYHAVLAEQNVRNAGTIMSFNDKFFVFDSGRLYVMGDGTFD